MAVKKGDADLRDRLDAVLARKKPEIESILDQYGIPRLPVSKMTPAKDRDGGKEGKPGGQARWDAPEAERGGSPCCD
jgi:hypothetical protein